MGWRFTRRENGKRGRTRCRTVLRAVPANAQLPDGAGAPSYFGLRRVAARRALLPRPRRRPRPRCKISRTRTRTMRQVLTEHFVATLERIPDPLPRRHGKHWTPASPAVANEAVVPAGDSLPILCRELCRRVHPFAGVPPSGLLVPVFPASLHTFLCASSNTRQSSRQSSRQSFGTSQAAGAEASLNPEPCLLNPVS
jgi:hypothetical protein